MRSLRFVSPMTSVGGGPKGSSSPFPRGTTTPSIFASSWFTTCLRYRTRAQVLHYSSFFFFLISSGGGGQIWLLERRRWEPSR